MSVEGSLHRCDFADKTGRIYSPLRAIERIAVIWVPAKGLSCMQDDFRQLATRNKNRKQKFVDRMLKPNVYESLIFTASSLGQN